MKEQLEAVARMQQYIEDNINEDIVFYNVAKCSMFSSWYARKLFIDYVGVSPSTYIRKSKLKHAALRLRDNKTKIIDVAFDLGFKSVDGFQRAFYKEFGCNPKEYASNPTPINLFISYNVLSKYKEKEYQEMKTKNIYIQVIEKPKRKVLIKRGIKATEYFSYCNEVGCDVWGLLVSIKSISNESVCLWLPKKYIKEGTSTYVQGVEVPADYKGPIPEGFDVIELPSSKYLMFQGEPFKEEDYEQAIGDVMDAINKYDPSVIGYSYDDSNPRIQLEPIGTRGYIELLPIK